MRELTHAINTRITRDNNAFNGCLYFYFRHDLPIEVQPGDELRVTFTYDTTSRNTTTSVGQGTDNEMCLAFLTFYPVENVHSHLSCVTWLKIPHCLIVDVINFAKKVKDNTFLKIGIKAAMNSLMNHG